MSKKPGQVLAGLFGRNPFHFSLFYMKASRTTPNTARGEVQLTIGGQQYPVRFGMNVMRDFTKLTGKAPSEFGRLLGEDYVEALSGLVYCAAKRYVPADQLPEGFYLDHAADLIDAMQPAEADEIGEAIVEAVTVGNPLLTALTAKVASKTQAVHEASLSESGTTSSTSLSVS
jgi:hypothetical protein